MNDERLYSIFTGTGHPWSTTAGSIKTVGHAWIAPGFCPMDFATILPSKGNANELDDEMSEIEPLKTGELIEPIMFEPKRKVRLSRSTYKVNSYIDFRPYRDSFKKFEAYIH